MNIGQKYSMTFLVFMYDKVNSGQSRTNFYGYSCIWTVLCINDLLWMWMYDLTLLTFSMLITQIFKILYEFIMIYGWNKWTEKQNLLAWIGNDFELCQRFIRFKYQNKMRSFDKFSRSLTQGNCHNFSSKWINGNFLRKVGPCRIHVITVLQANALFRSALNYYWSKFDRQRLSHEPLSCSIPPMPDFNRILERTEQ